MISSQDAMISLIEASESLDQLRDRMHRIAQDFGFHSFSFVDLSQPHLETPFYFGTSGIDWEREYDNNNFIRFDPCIRKARRSNTPFVWAESVPDDYAVGRKTGLRRLMDAAFDYEFKEGLVVPCHYRDGIGRVQSACGVFYWKDRPEKLYAMLEEGRLTLHLLMIYLIQKTLDLKAQHSKAPRPTGELDGIKLSDRERDVLNWAAQGKSTAEIAEILSVAAKTVEIHVGNAIKKLDCRTRGQAIAKGIMLGVIDL